MRALIIQHVDFEKPGYIEEWLRENSIPFRILNPYLGEEFPSSAETDYLFIMGGPMGVHDEEKYSWMRKERDFIRRSIQEGVKVLGVCLGAQILASILGAPVKKGVCDERGWKRVYLSPKARSSRFFRDFPDSFIAFHWHSDMFEIPEGSFSIARTDECGNQAFERDNVLALQFHLEVTPDILRALMEHEGFIREEWLDEEMFSRSRELMFKILDRL